MEQLNICTIQSDKIKYNDKNIAPTMHKKLSKRSKHKKKKADKKEKKYKRRKKCLSSSNESDNSDEFEWVEKKVKDQISSHITKSFNNSKTQKNQLERDEWMNVESFLPYLSKSDRRIQKPDMEKEDKTQILLNKPGQSDRELNPYWKNGGNGLPQNSLERFDNSQNLDANWLKKSLQRAEEQALRDGKNLEEIAAERWGSLETIQSMIHKAEKMSNTVQDKSYKKYCNERNNKDLHRISSSKIRSHSRSRSRSRECARKYSYDYLSHRTEQTQMYWKPKDNDCYQQSPNRFTTNNYTKNWKKDKGDDRKYESELSKSKLKETNIENINNTNELNKSKSTSILTEAEMNKLGARIIKAELMGDDELATQLKIQLEQARKLVAANNTNVQEETVIFIRTDAKGIVRPIQPRRQCIQFAQTHRKKKTAETHVSGERIRYFVDDDKYSLQEMFQREKEISTNEDEVMFAKLASRNMDHMDDGFEQQIARTNLEAKEDKRDRTRAIKEHKDLSKYMDNCWWCLDSKNMLKHMVITMDSMICLSLPACTSLTTGHCILTPVQHVACQLQLDENIWDKLKDFKRRLIKMFMNEDLYPIFFEVYKRRRKFSHMQLECIPLPKEIGESAPMYFKKALLECETEWSINKKIVDLKSKDIRHAVPNGLSYFMIEFASHPGYAHVIEDEELFPKNFAEQIISGMLNLDYNLWRKPKKQNFDKQRIKVLEFTKTWKKYNSPQDN